MQNLDSQAIAFFCPHLKIINSEYVDEKANDQFTNYILHASKCLEPIVSII